MSAASLPDLVIKLKLDRSQHDASARKATAAQRAVESAANRAAKAAEVAATRQAKAAEAAATRTQKAAEKAAAAQARAADRAAKQADQSAQKSATAQVKAADKKAASIAAIERKYLAREYKDRATFEARKQKEADRSADQAQRLADRRAAAEAKAIRKVLTEEEVALKARNAMTDRANKARVAGAVNETSVVGRLRNAYGGVADKIGGVGGIAAAVGVAAAAGNALIEMFQGVRDSIYDAVKMADDYRESLLELAALKGRFGRTGEEMAEDLGFRAKTLQDRGEATAFQQAALGAGQAAIDEGGVKKLIAPEEFRKAMEKGGAFQAGEGGSAATHGTLIGQLPNLLGRRTDADEVARKEQQLFNIAQPGGAEFTPMVDQFLQNAPLVTTGLLTPERSMALHSAFSTTNKAAFGTDVEHLTKATVGSLGRMKGVKIEGAEKVGPYLKRLGATDQMDPIEIADLISKDMAKQEAADGKAGKKFNAMDYLHHRGYGNEQDVMALMGYHGMKKSGTWDKTFLPLTEKMPTAAEADAPIERFQQTDAVAQKRKADLAGDLANASMATGAEGYADKLGQIAFARLKANKHWSGKIEDTRDSTVWSSYLKDEQLNVLEEEYKRKGLDVPDRLTKLQSKNYVSQFSGPRQLLSDASFAKELHGFGQDLGSKGGEMLPGTDAMVEAVQKNTEATTRLTDALMQQRGAAPRGGANPGAGLPARPAPVRNARM